MWKDTCVQTQIAAEMLHFGHITVSLQRLRSRPSFWLACLDLLNLLSAMSTLVHTHT
jgi:hypothetical protein